jgi:hypothetical protein
MSDQSQPQPVPQDDENKNDKNEQNKEYKYTVKLFGRYVPIWIVVLVVVVLAWVAWYMWTENQKKVVRLTSSARMDLDNAVATSASPLNASPLNASPATPSAGIPLSTPGTEEVRNQLNKLFNSF